MCERDIVLVFRGSVGALEIMGGGRLVNSLAAAAAIMKEA